MNREQKSDLSFAYSIEPGAPVATEDGDGVDLRGFDSATIEVRYGDTINVGTLFKIQDSDDDVIFADLVPAAKPDVDVFLLGPDIPAAGVANTSFKYGYVGSKRFIRVITTAVPGATDFLALVVRGRPGKSPVA